MDFFDGNHRSPSTPSRTRPHGNLAALRIAVVLLFAVLAAQLANMQLIQGEEYARRSRENHLTRKEILPARGLIYDRNGTALVENIGVYTATITPIFLPDEADVRYDIYLRLEAILDVPALEIQAMVQDAEAEGRPDIEIPLKKYLTKEQAIRIEEATTDMPGVALAIQPGRNYIAGPAFSHILGYVGDQNAEEYLVLQEQGYSLNEPVGKAGVEARYQSELRGVKGVTAAEQDAQGNLITALRTRDPIAGNSVQLSIDAELQTFVTELLEDSLPDPNYQTATTAAAVVMNAKTGELYALASVPTYDNNIFSQLDSRAEEYVYLATKDPRRPLVNQALTQSAPGSTFKLITAAAGLQEGNITPQTSRDVSSRILEIKGENGEIYPLVDWRAHGSINLTSAIAWSSNIYMFMTACGIPDGTAGGGHKGLGKDVIDSAVILGHYARAFGLGRQTGLDIGGDESGIVPSPEWLRRIRSGPEFNDGDRDWYYAYTCHMAIGQGFVTATPLQISLMTAAVANGGKLLTPRVGHAVIGPEGEVVKTFTPETQDVPVAPEHLATVRQGMLESVVAGAGARAAVPGMTIAGKTGTAEFGNPRPDGSFLQHAWFTGFYPYEDPEFVVTVYFDLGVGGDKAAPVAGRIFSWLSENFAR